mgnify:FL=1
MYFDLDKIKEQVEQVYEEVLAFRRDLHMHPELSEQEIRTEEKICSRLDALQIPYQRGVAGHGVCAVIRGTTADRTVGIRADIDALPVAEQTELAYASLNLGVMHACGHDMHTAILLGTAAILKQNADTLPGTVKLFFQPSEETIGGAKQMIDAGCLEDPHVENVIALHVDPMTDLGKLKFTKGCMNAATTEMELTVRGKACHGAHPDTGIDVLPPACSIVAALQTIVSRNLAPTTPAVVTVGTFQSGTAKNVISGEAKLGGTIRALDLDVMAYLKKRVQKIAVDTAEAYGTSCEVFFEDSYPPLRNSDELSALLLTAMEEVFGTENILRNGIPSLGADDFSYFTQTCRGLYFDLGTHDPCSDEYFPLHSEHFAPQEEAVKVGMLAELTAVYTILHG